MTAVPKGIALERGQKHLRREMWISESPVEGEHMEQLQWNSGSLCSYHISATAAQHARGFSEIQGKHSILQTS